MAYGLSENTIKEIQAFYHRDFISKDNLGWKIRLLTEKCCKPVALFMLQRKALLYTPVLLVGLVSTV